ncbi:hypothetical protein MFIFM68171_02195 [Madurella fahalii]|uniref:Uncharacterized protein n=1 Tax=Madurella fahalii TaxID=1157608 RepID=A0ABQ0G352_9PEZI
MGRQPSPHNITPVDDTQPGESAVAVDAADTQQHGKQTPTTPDVTASNGWEAVDTNDASVKSLWAKQTGRGRALAERYGLRDPRPLLTTTPESGDCVWLFASSGKHYVWNEVEGTLFAIVSPSTLAEITTLMGPSGFKGV